MDLIFIVKQVLLFFAVLGQVIIALLIFAFLAKQKAITSFFAKRALVFAFLVALLGTLGSLFYSEIVGYEPCKLCWFQRIFLYPQLIILWMALLKRDNNIAPYSIALSAFGASIALYHYLLQLGVAPSIGCVAQGYSISCSQKFVMEFGYITLPLMSLTAFLLILGFMLVPKIKNG